MVALPIKTLQEHGCRQKDGRNRPLPAFYYLPQAKKWTVQTRYR